MLIEDMDGTDNWYTEIQQYAMENEINIQIQFVMEISYQQYKKHVKDKIRMKINKELEEGKRSKTKLRWIRPGVDQEYLKKSSIQEAAEIMKFRLHMTKAKGNYGGGICRKCGEREETTEHVLVCHTDGNVELDSGKMEDVGWLRKITNIFRKFEEEYELN